MSPRTLTATLTPHLYEWCHNAVGPARPGHDIGTPRKEHATSTQPARRPLTSIMHERWREHVGCRGHRGPPHAQDTRFASGSRPTPNTLARFTGSLRRPSLLLAARGRPQCFRSVRPPSPYFLTPVLCPPSAGGGGAAALRVTAAVPPLKAGGGTPGSPRLFPPPPGPLRGALTPGRRISRSPIPIPDASGQDTCPASQSNFGVSRRPPSAAPFSPARSGRPLIRSLRFRCGLLAIVGPPPHNRQGKPYPAGRFAPRRVPPATLRACPPCGPAGG